MWRGEKLIKETRHPAALQTGSDAAGSRVYMEAGSREVEQGCVSPRLKYGKIYG